MDNKREFNKRGASSFYNNLIVNIVCRILFYKVFFKLVARKVIVTASNITE